MFLAVDRLKRGDKQDLITQFARGLLSRQPDMLLVGREGRLQTIPIGSRS